MELEVKTRDILGKKVSALRRDGFVPGEVYGRGMKNIHISVPEKALVKIWKQAGENTVVSLRLGADELSALISDMVLDHLTQRPLTVDFRCVQKGEKVIVHVPVVLHGESPAEKEGLTVMHILHEIEIESLPTDIPHEFTVDISSLVEAGQSISVEDLKIPKNVDVLTEKQSVIVIVSEQQKEEEIAPPPPAESAAETPATGEIPAETIEKNP